MMKIVDTVQVFRSNLGNYPDTFTQTSLDEEVKSANSEIYKRQNEAKSGLRSC